ncbi:MAG: hypothetical protein LBC38_02150 [Oscillospiraceae bacterium]|jgi:hypothetical protein|nr:hypothetical protein [Oscillospiraceae bacterium]
MAKTSAAVINRYQKKHYRRMEIQVKIPTADLFRQLLVERGDTMSGVLGKAIDDYIAMCGKPSDTTKT